MNRNKSQIARLNELDRLIRGREYPNCKSFAATWGVAQKTIQRDIDFLRDQCGAPVVYCRERQGFAYEDETWFLPAVKLSEGEIIAILVASRAVQPYAGTPIAAHLDRIFRKLVDVLPDQVSIRPELFFSGFSFRGPPAKPISEPVWLAVVRALLNRQILEIAYHRFETPAVAGKRSRLCPYHLANLQGEWYVFGVHEGYADVRQFALSRIETAKPTAGRFSVPADFDPQAYLDTAFARYAGSGQVQDVRLLFRKSVAEWVTERIWHPKQTLKYRRNGDIELAFPAAGLYEVQRWVLSWGRWVKVLAPSALAASVADEIQQMLACQ